MPGLIPRVGGQASSRLLQNGSAKSTLAAENLSVSALGKRKPSPPVLSNTTDGVAVDHVMTDALVETNRPKIQQLSSVTVLEGHTAGLDQCLWHPSSEDMLVTSSVDGTARIWSLPQKADDSVSSIVLNCTPCRTADKSVTSVAWNVRFFPMPDKIESPKNRVEHRNTSSYRILRRYHTHMEL